MSVAAWSSNVTYVQVVLGQTWRHPLLGQVGCRFLIDFDFTRSDMMSLKYY